MKSFGFLVLLSLFLFVLGSKDLIWAADPDVLHGEVLEMDKAMQSMVIRLDSIEGAGRLVNVQFSETVRIVSPDGSQNMPECIVRGKHVRIWGAVRQGNAQQFMAEEIRACGMAACSDPTGVRSRLSRKRQSKPMGDMCR